MNLTALAAHYRPLLDLAIAKKFDFESADQGLILEYFGPISGMYECMYACMHVCMFVCMIVYM
jgi:hypothetical protein